MNLPEKKKQRVLNKLHNTPLHKQSRELFDSTVKFNENVLNFM